MPLLIPPELQQHILRGVSDEAKRAPNPNGRQSLRTCSLVCKAWHLWTLEHTFEKLRIPATPRQTGAKDLRSYLARQTPRARLDQLLDLLESNPRIGEAVKILEVFIYGMPDTPAPAREPPMQYITPDQFSRLSRYITRPETLIVRSSSPYDIAFYPGFLDGLCNLCWTTTLRSLSFFCPTFPKVLLTYAPNIQEFRASFSTMSNAVPQRTTHPQAFDKQLPRLRTLRILRPSPSKLQDLQDFVQSNSRLSNLFSCLEEVEIDIEDANEYPHPWKSQLFSSNLQHLVLFTDIHLHDSQCSIHSTSFFAG